MTCASPSAIWPRHEPRATRPCSTTDPPSPPPAGTPSSGCQPLPALSASATSTSCTMRASMRPGSWTCLGAFAARTRQRVPTFRERRRVCTTRRSRSSQKWPALTSNCEAPRTSSRSRVATWRTNRRRCGSPTRVSTRGGAQSSTLHARKRSSARHSPPSLRWKPRFRDPSIVSAC